ncbi:hypothetical protein GQ44DRAFT_714228 [Phaeosphaeriaceae sp. PMI808]|nr:hypothetical protein GQ44DRAFT_714228 [Phaeosphaeriaceae sp. PMI808]
MPYHHPHTLPSSSSSSSHISLSLLPTIINPHNPPLPTPKLSHQNPLFFPANPRTQYLPAQSPPSTPSHHLHRIATPIKKISLPNLSPSPHALGPGPTLPDAAPDPPPRMCGG